MTIHPAGHSFSSAIVLLVTSLSLAPAQVATTSKDPAQWALLYTRNLEKNRDALAKYTWQYRVAVMEGEELLYVDVLEATRDAEGNLVTKTLEHDLKIKQRQGLLSKAGQEKRLAEIEEKIEFLKGVIHSYVYMSRGQVVDFFDKAEVSEAIGYRNALRVDGDDVIRSGDYVTLFGDRGTARPLNLTFSVPFNEKLGVDGSVEFRSLRNSTLFYGAEITANFVELKKPGRAKIVSVEVESYDFQRK
ncbi:MAG: hypothetical protein AAGC68_10175 [Verrucomicrobiota bacterium]